MKNENPYLQQIARVLPRLLALFDRDMTSPTCGVGDRYYWGWKLIDFGNGTFQGAAHGIAKLVQAGLLPEWFSETSALARMDAMFHGAETLRYPNGSMEEAFPHENSFCVTALVAYDLLSAIENVQDKIEQEKQQSYLNVVQPMIAFLHRADEKHAFISNHLATAVAALTKWNILTGKPGQERAELFLNRILQAQSTEGWYREYEGADPGYQTLCTYYLADVYQMTGDQTLLESLKKSVQFLQYFAHPDGSFGGNYGSRNTRFFYPAGIEYLSLQIPEAAALARFMRQSIAQNQVVTLETMDEANLIPMFNAYARAASFFKKNTPKAEAVEPLPCFSNKSWRKRFDDAGFIVDNQPNTYTILSWHKGGVCYHFEKKTQKSFIDAGVVCKNKKGQIYSTQAYNRENQIEVEKDSVTITSAFSLMHKDTPTPVKFIVLRLLNVTLMRSLYLGDLIKRALVKYLITGRKEIPLKNIRTIHLSGTCQIDDRFDGDSQGFEKIDVQHPFSAIHMASLGYWQQQDDRR